MNTLPLIPGPLKVPPGGFALRVYGASLVQATLGAFTVTPPGEKTLMVLWAVSVHPFPSVNVYVITWAPAPATDGSNDPLDTPVPLYVPPEGLPPESVNELVEVHTSEKEPRVTVGSAFTVMKFDLDSVSEPPLVVTLRETFLPPLVAYTTLTGLVVAEEGVPPVKVHVLEVMVPEVVSVKVTVSPTQTVVGDAVNPATGADDELD